MTPFPPTICTFGMLAFLSLESLRLRTASSVGMRAAMRATGRMQP